MKNSVPRRRSTTLGRILCLTMLTLLIGCQGGVTSRESAPSCPLGNPAAGVGFAAVLRDCVRGDRYVCAYIEHVRRITHYCTCELPSWKQGKLAKSCKKNR